MDKREARELERLAGHTESLDRGLAEARGDISDIKRTINGDSTKPLDDGGIVGDIRRTREQIQSWKKWLKYLIVICTAIGAFIADVGKDMISEVINRKIYHSSSEAWKEEAGKQKVIVKHFKITANPQPTRKTIKETKDKIVQEIWIDVKPEDGEELLR